MTKKKQVPCKLSVNVENSPVIRLFVRILRCAAEVGATSVTISPKDQKFSIFCSDGKNRRRIETDGNWRFVSAIVVRAKIISDLMISVKDRRQVGEFKTTAIKGFTVWKIRTWPTKDGESLRVDLIK